MSITEINVHLLVDFISVRSKVLNNTTLWISKIRFGVINVLLIELVKKHNDVTNETMSPIAR